METQLHPLSSSLVSFTRQRYEGSWGGIGMYSCTLCVQPTQQPNHCFVIIRAGYQVLLNENSNNAGENGHILLGYKLAIMFALINAHQTIMRPVKWMRLYSNTLFPLLNAHQTTIRPLKRVRLYSGYKLSIMFPYMKAHQTTTRPVRRVSFYWDTRWLPCFPSSKQPDYKKASQKVELLLGYKQAIMFPLINAHLDITRPMKRESYWDTSKLSCFP